MAYTVKLGTFAKKINSTAQPDMTGWAEFSVVLKQGSELTDPTLQLNVDESDVVNYNYAYLFGSYYWITSRKMVRTDLCEIKLEKDVLASYKLEIGSSNLYILRSSVSYNGGIVDNYYPATAHTQITSEQQDSDTVPAVDFDSGYYLLTVMGASGAAGTGSEIIYQMSSTEFFVFLLTLFSGINGLQVADFWNEINKLFGGNPQDLISGCVWVPYAFPYRDRSSLTIGSYELNITGHVVTKNVIDLATVYYTLPKHPQASTRGSFLSTAPFTNYTLSLNCGGIIELDSSKLMEKTQIRVRRQLDVKGGLFNIIDTGATADTILLGKIYGQMGVPIDLKGNGTGAVTISSLFSTIGSTAALVASGGSANALAAVSAGVGTVVSAAGATSNTASGFVAGLDEPGRLTSVFYYAADEDNANNGRPLCQVTQPALIGGYMIAQKPTISISAPLPEQQKIGQFLTTGFYYE